MSGAPRSQTEQNVALILKHLRHYMDLRFSHARRLNPKFKAVEGDMKWHELECVKQVLARQKPLGEFRVSPGDIIVGFDVEKKRGVFLPKGQLSIQNEIITKEDAGLVKGGAADGIRDLSSFYKAVDPFLKSVVDLMQTWVWWDLPDAADMAIMDSQFDKLTKIPRMQMSEALANYYKNDVKGEMSIQSIVDLEFGRAEETVLAIQRRREFEENYQNIIAREGDDGGAGDSPADATVVQLAQHLRAVEMMKKSGDVDASLRDYYAKALQCAPADVTAEKALAYAGRIVAQTKKQLAEQLDAGDSGGGAPYNFKLRQLAEIRARLEAFRAELKPRAQTTSQQE